MAAGVLLVALSLVGLSLLGLVGYVWAVSSETFRVRQVRVVGAKLTSVKDIVRRAGLDRPASVLALNIGRISRAVVGAPFVDSARVSRSLNGTVTIHLREHRPFALLRLDKLYYVDHKGAPFKAVGPADRVDYPVISGFDKRTLTKGDPGVRGRIKRAVAFLRRLDRQGGILKRRNVSEVIFDPDRGYSVILLTGPAGVRFGFGRIGVKLGRLYTVLKKLREMGRRVSGSIVDLDYRDRAVVRVLKGGRS